MRQLNWLSVTWRLFLMSVGAAISAFSVLVFEAPFQIAPGGVSGIAVILNYQFNWSLGLIVLLGNIPILIYAFRTLGGWRALAATIYTTVLYSFLLEAMVPYVSPTGIGNNVLLNALFGGIIGGIGAGIVYRAGGTLGGTSTLGRILQQKYGIPLSSSALYTDTIVILAAGFIFGWEPALYAIVTLFVAGVAADYVLEGPSVIRTAVIITNLPREVADTVMKEMGRGVTGWEGKGMFTEQPRHILYVTIARAQVNQLRRLVMDVDPKAFMVIGQGHAAYGHGFKEMNTPAREATQDGGDE